MDVKGIQTIRDITMHHYYPKHPSKTQMLLTPYNRMYTDVKLEEVYLVTVKVKPVFGDVMH